MEKNKNYPYDETLEAIIALFHEDTALFIIIEDITKYDDTELDEQLRDQK